MKRKITNRKKVSNCSYRNVNLELNSSHYDFIYEMVEFLNSHFRKSEIALLIEKGKIMEVGTDTFTMKTPAITCIKIIVDGIMSLTFHGLMDGICLFDLNVSDDFRRKGIGRKVLSEICEISNAMDIPVYLIPVDYEACIGEKVLMNFYHSCNFNKKSKSNYWVYYPIRIQIAC